MNNDPSDRRIQRFAGPAQLARAAAQEVAQRLAAAVRSSGHASIALSGGSTPKTLYSLLAGEAALRDLLPWKETHFFFGDERHVPPDDKESNYRMAKEAMFGPLGATCPAANIHRIRGELPDAAQAAAAYEAELAEHFESADGPLPRFDVVLLGMGPDGHTASLFPGTTGLRDTDRLVTSAWVDKFSTYRITLTPPALCNAAAILFLVAGKEKEDVLKAVLEGPAEPDRYPSQGISAYNGETVWMIDEAAGAKLSDARG